VGRRTAGERACGCACWVSLRTDGPAHHSASSPSAQIPSEHVWLVTRCCLKVFLLTDARESTTDWFGLSIHLIARPSPGLLLLKLSLLNSGQPVFLGLVVSRRRSLSCRMAPPCRQA